MPPKKPASAITPSPTPDRHASRFMVRLEESYRDRLRKLVEQGRIKDLTDGAREALDLWLGLAEPAKDSAVQAQMLRAVSWELLPAKLLAEVVALINKHTAAK